ncbi:hypothetical protein ACFL6M_01785 [Candidatus Eisenbacteria bacterium]|uniref:Integral membrane protein n=1 Tax=Eiseniibacteriota bacterium TaxID=2212470 RepID=A0ABV6YIY5_UNCEI
MTGPRIGATTATGNRPFYSRLPIESRIPLLFLALLIVSTIGCFVFRDHWAEVIVFHAGGLAIVGLLASLAGFIAKKKGRDYGRAVLWSIAIPVTLGVCAVALVYVVMDFVYCGGGVILAAALIMIAVQSCLRRRNVTA